MTAINDARQRLDRLSEREWEILRLRADGLSYSAIGKKLHIEKSTVNEHLGRAYIKLDIDQNESKPARLAILKATYYPILRALNVWPGRNLPARSAPRELIPLTVRALSYAINDEDETDDTKWLEPVTIQGLVRPDDRLVIDGEIVQPEQLPPGQTGRRGLPGDGTGERPPLQLAGRQAKSGSFLGLGILLGVILAAGAAFYSLSSGLLRPYLPTAPSQIVEVTKVYVTPGQVVQITTTPEPSQTPQPTFTPLPTYTPLPDAIAAPLEANPIPTVTVIVEVTSTPQPGQTFLATPVAMSLADAVTFGDEQSGFAAPWHWQVGASPDSSFKFDSDPKSVTVFAGRQTNYSRAEFTGPSLTRPISDVVDIQAQIDFDPKAGNETAGLGIQSVKDRTNWITVRRFSDGQSQWIEAAASRSGG